MKLEITDVESFVDFLKSAARVVPRKTTLSSIQNIKLVAEKGTLEATATDLGTTIILKVDANIKEEGSALVPAQFSVALLDQLKKEESLSFAISRNKLNLKSSKGTYKLDLDNPDSFVRNPEIESDVVTMKLPGSVLSTLFSSTVFACSDDEYRPALTGVAITVGETYIEACGTDGHKMSVYRYDDMGELTNFKLTFTKIVTRDGAKLFPNLFDSEPEVLVEFGGKFIAFTAGNKKMFVRLIEESYVDYHVLIPKAEAIKCSVKIVKEGFLAGLKRLGILAVPDASKKLHVVFGEEVGSVKFTLQNQYTQAEAWEKFPIEYSGKEKIDFLFNSRLLSDVVRAVNDTEFHLYIQDTLSPVMVTPVNTDIDQKILVVPMRDESKEG